MNLYQLMCHVMKLKAAPHNGTWTTVCDALADSEACKDGPYQAATSMVASFCLVIVAAMFAVLFDLFSSEYVCIGV